MSSPLGRDSRVRLHRLPHRGRYDRGAIDDILDTQLVAHVAFIDGGTPFCVPMLQARLGGELYVHGSSGSRALRVLATGAAACVTVTTIDALVLARSAFEHSANYRSAMLLGSFRAVTGDRARLAAFEAFTNKILPGRWNEVRPPNRKELASSAILAMPIDTASAKIRNGPPDDDDTPDADTDTWAGILPVTTTFGQPQASPGLRNGIAVPDSVLTLLTRRSDGADRQ